MPLRHSVKGQDVFAANPTIINTLIQRQYFYSGDGATGPPVPYLDTLLPLIFSKLDAVLRMTKGRL